MDAEVQQARKSVESETKSFSGDFPATIAPVPSLRRCRALTQVCVGGPLPVRADSRYRRAENPFGRHILEQNMHRLRDGRCAKALT